MINPLQGSYTDPNREILFSKTARANSQKLF
jgi:hypothetical protein